MRKFFRKAHKWLAAPALLFLIIICITGSILVFKDEILEISNPSRYFVEEVKDSPIPLSQLMPMVNAQLKDNTVVDVKISSDAKRTYNMSLAEGFRVSVFVNQYTGKITGKYDTKESWLWDVMLLHRWLMDGTRTWGKYIVGITTLLTVFILISGFILWIPRRKVQWKKNLTIKRKAGRKRLMYDLHNVLGAYASVILLACCLTGLMWSFDWYRNGVFALFGAKVEESTRGGGGKGGDKPKELPIVDATQWDEALSKVIHFNPNYDYVRVQEGAATVHDKRAMRTRDTDKYTFDQTTGELGTITYYNQQPKTAQIWGWAYSIHVGDYWGIWSKILTCLASLIGASLPITGYCVYYWKAKRKRGRIRNEKKSVYLKPNN